MKKYLLLAACILATFAACSPAPVQQDVPIDEGGDKPDNTVPAGPLPKALVISASVDGKKIPSGGSIGGVSLSPEISLTFTREISVDEASLDAVTFSGGSFTVERDPSVSSVLVVRLTQSLEHLKKYKFEIAAGECFGVNLQQAYSFSFTTAFDDSGDKFPQIPDEELLTLVQQRTFKYFWDYGHPVSGLARERYNSGDTVTSGGSGFGIMAIPVGIERGFITRAEGAERMRKIVSFLASADRFHGAYSHWLDGSTGKVIPFGDNDNGGDLVETGFLIEGLLTASAYFNRSEEADIRSGIDEIWRGVEWDWYTRGGQNQLYWHWSPDKGWVMNMKIKGWNEALITYVLAASSPTHPISADVFHSGWGSFKFPVATNQPLFFAHYSFLGLDPRKLSDSSGSYWAQNVAHAQYNYDYCVRNPQNHTGYSANCWGLTASDYPGGYIASAPANDTGTIAPTAAVASIPYLPEESMAAIRYFYYKLGDRLWGTYGFKDAFCPDKAWFASSYIAIDQGPIIVMIENYRTQLLWNLFMQNEDVRAGLDKLGFTYE